MRKIILSSLVTALVAASSVQTAAATERHQGKTSNRPAMTEQLRNSNAYAEPANIAQQAGRPGLTEGAMSSGIAGH